MPDERSDDEILKRVQAGDRSAFMELFDRHYGRLERYARYQLRNAETARDIASETFLRAYRNVDKFRVGEISWIGYLFVICRRLILTERQRMSVSQTVPLEPILSDGGAGEPRLTDTTDQPIEMMLRAERSGMVKEALRSLSPDDREIILLAFEEELSRKDIAPLLGKPTVSAVTSHLHRAMQKLKSALDSQGYFPGTRAAERERT